jgi:hypothetical protein
MVVKSLDAFVMNLKRKIGPFAVIVAQLGGKEMEWTLDKILDLLKNENKITK